MSGDKRCRDASKVLPSGQAAWMLDTAPGLFYEQGFAAGAAALALAEDRLQAVHQTLNEYGAPTHDANGAKLNANGRLVDFLAASADGSRKPAFQAMVNA